MLPPKERFTDRVSDYVKFRPSYPAEVIDFIVSNSDLGRLSVVGDIGCGTGIFSQLLLGRGLNVVGVEPNASMLAAAREALDSNPRFVANHSSAEDTGLPSGSIDAITAAQAFHWFDPAAAKAEFRRVLKPNGWIYLVWNERVATGSMFAEAYEALIQDVSAEYREVGHRNRTEAELLDWFEADAKLVAWDNFQVLDKDGFLGRSFSSSYMPAAGTAEREELAKRLAEMYESHQSEGGIRLDYCCKVFAGRLKPGPDL